MSVRARAWTALLLPPVAWFVFQQGLSAVLHGDCSRSDLGLAWGAASLAACGIALRIGWTLREPHGALGDPWLARLALMLTGVFALAILFQTLAVLLVPTCLR